jgi:hypothetical protein
MCGIDDDPSMHDTPRKAATMKVLDDEDAIIADLAYWQELSKRIPGWRLMGFTYRHTASYISRDGGVVNLTDSQRDDILDAIRCTSDDAGNHQGDTCPVHEVAPEYPDCCPHGVPVYKP